ncbi:MAG: response regulator [Actinobacteria bacterium]|nr:response regulator [Actinomycetota bacterium]
MREGMVQILQKMKLDVRDAEDGASGLKIIESRPVDLVVTDYRMSEMNGVEILEKVKQKSPQTEVMVITAYGSIDLAVEAMQKGAADFITKPFSHQEFRLKIERILSKLVQEEKLRRLSEENIYLREELDDQFNFGEIIGDSAKMQQLYRTIGKVAKTDSSVIIYGESGTGKELVARAIHKSGMRAQNPFIRVNCGALADGVLESELFGHEKGAFTGALRRKKGRFELADLGTIFLDEIGDLPLSTQVKLLRVLQEREFERVGGEETLTVDVRVIAATNRDLKKLVDENSFRKDLYYRLHIIPIYLPPLRDRREDISTLANHFIGRITVKLGLKKIALSSDALAALQNYDWPGNVRELENILERSAVLADTAEITASDLPFLTPRASAPSFEMETLDLNAALAQVEKMAIVKALEKANGAKSEAARILGIKTGALYYKLEKYELI